MGKHNRSIAERLNNISPITECGCHIWMGAIGGYGYGHLKIGGQVVGAHRLSWQLSHGKIPEGMFVLHRCDVRSCINPDHLFLGDHDANMADKKAKRRAPHGSGHHRREVSEIKAIEIKTSSAPVGELAAKLGLKEGTVRQIRNNKRWKYIEVTK